MAFAEMIVLVDGAIDSREILYDETLLNARLQEIEEDAESDGLPTTVYVTFHEHDRDAECTCGPRSTPPKPYQEFNNPREANSGT